MPLTGPHLALPTDSAALAQCHTSAFSSAGPRTVYNLIFSRCCPDTMLKLESKIIEASFMPESRSRIVVMRDEHTREIVSYAQWILPASDEMENDTTETIEQGKAEAKNFDFPDCVNSPLFRRIFFKTEAERGEKGADLPVPKEKCWNLSRIGTRPEYQGQGAATALMKWGMDQADLDGRYCALSADPDQSAFQTYKKAGFRVFGRVSEIELEPFRSTGILRYVHMIRPPKKTE